MAFYNNSIGRDKKLLFVGIILILIGIVLNDWVIASIFQIKSDIINLANHLMFLFLNIPLILSGIYLITTSKQHSNERVYKYITNILLVFLSLFICLVIVELFLRLDYFSEHDKSFPIFIPYKFKKINMAINEKNLAVSRQHPFGFNDKVRSAEKPEGVFRVAVLGDSFVWGDGVPYEMIWSHRLEDKIHQVFGNQVEVLSWGLRGWSTLDQFNFLREKGLMYHPDLLIICFTANDPDLGNYPQKYFKINLVPLVWPLRALLPNAVDFFSEHLEAAVNHWSSSLGYQNWENRLYSQENLARYGELLEQLAEFCASHGIRLLFVLTPCYHDPGHRLRFAAIVPLLRKARIDHLDLYPALEEKLKGYQPRELWANRANPHPGILQTEIYATVVFDYLRAHYLQ